jgi:adenylosuccinate synthase
MPNLAVIGAQWGDEGKGKVIDMLSGHFDVVARFQGGPNAGHTVTIGDERHALHHVPSGVFRPEVRVVIGNGTVIDLAKLLAELGELTAAGVTLDGRLFISDRAHVILPFLQALDGVAERTADAESRIGTTLRGIGPTYEAKAARWGIRMADLAAPQPLTKHVQRILSGPVGQRLREGGEDPGNAADLASHAHELYQKLAHHVCDTVALLNGWIDEGASVMFEGAQGTLLDVDHGSYPYVTSSNTMAGAVCAGLGVSPRLIDRVLGVFKAYSTRVGAGPMPTELADGPQGAGERLRQRGREYGTTTGRPRRCGWFDGVAARYANRINRFDGACVMLLDVLDAFEEIQVCTTYRDRQTGAELQRVPASMAQLQQVEPVYERLEGWKHDTTAVRAWEKLPPAAQRYLDRLGEIIGTEVVLAGVGPERSQSLVRPGSWLARRIGA